MPEGGKNEEPIIGDPKTGQWIEEDDGTLRFSPDTKDYVVMDLKKEIAAAENFDSLLLALRGHGCENAAKKIEELREKMGKPKTAYEKDMNVRIIYSGELFKKITLAEIGDEELNPPFHQKLIELFEKETMSW